MIDAEVTKLDTVIDLKPGMTLEDLKREVIAYEKKSFYEKTDMEHNRRQGPRIHESRPLRPDSGARPCP